MWRYVCIYVYVWPLHTLHTPLHSTTHHTTHHQTTPRTTQHNTTHHTTPRTTQHNTTHHNHYTRHISQSCLVYDWFRVSFFLQRSQSRKKNYTIHGRSNIGWRRLSDHNSYINIHWVSNEYPYIYINECIYLFIYI